jgi:K+-sensing histidine kinase KdpD
VTVTAGRLLGTLVALLAISSLATALIMSHAAERHADEVSQRQNASIAMYVDRESRLFVSGEPDRAALDRISRQATVLNPLASVYLLDTQGRVVGGAGAAVDLAPVRDFLAGPLAGPIYGDDPASPGTQRVFSVHPVVEAGVAAGYVYVVLGRDAIASPFRTIASSRILQVAILLLAVLLTSAILAAMWLTRMAIATRTRLAVVTAADQTRRRLFESVGHDLRTPLTAVRGYVELLQQDRAMLSPAERQRHLDALDLACRRLSRLVTQIFQLSRLESESLVLQREPVVVQELAQDIAATLRSSAPGARAEIELDLDPAAPAVLGDMELLESVIENLLDNALRHGGPDGKVRLRVRRQQEAIVVEIQDQGPGFGDLDVLRLAHLRPEGFRDRRGLGLAIVTRALHHLGSRLELTSSPGKGALVSFSLALAP